VQLGAFAGREAAARLVATLRAKGYAAFVLEYRRDGKVLYRVRVGPEQDRQRAVAIAARLNREGYRASVAPHP
jgi:DedD protein